TRARVWWTVAAVLALGARVTLWGGGGFERAPGAAKGSRTEAARTNAQATPPASSDRTTDRPPVGAATAATTAVASTTPTPTSEPSASSPPTSSAVAVRTSPVPPKPPPPKPPVSPKPAVTATVTTDPQFGIKK